MFRRRTDRPAAGPLARQSTVAASVELELLAEEVVKVAHQIRETVQVLRWQDESEGSARRRSDDR